MSAATTSEFWTPAAVSRDLGCSAEDLQNLADLFARGSVSGRDFRETRFAIGDWLVAAYGPPVVGAQSRHDERIEALAERFQKSPQTLRKARMMAHRWRLEQRDRVLTSRVYVPFTVMRLVAQGDSSTRAFDVETFDRNVDVLLVAMAKVESSGVLEVSETDYLGVLRKAQPPSRRPGAASERKAVVATVQQFEAQQPEVRQAVLDAVRADAEARRSIAAAYLMERPALARAVLREEPELAKVAAHEQVTTAQDTRTPGPTDEDEVTLREFVHLLGGGRPSDDLLLAEWREDFAQALARVSQLISSWYPSSTVAERADEDLLHVVTHLAQDMNEWAESIKEARKPGLRVVGRTAQ